MKHTVSLIVYTSIMSLDFHQDQDMSARAATPVATYLDT